MGDILAFRNQSLVPTHFGSSAHPLRTTTASVDADIARDCFGFSQITLNRRDYTVQTSPSSSKLVHSPK